MLVPINRKYGARRNLLDACRRFPLQAAQPDHVRIRDAATSVNDTPEDARRLVEAAARHQGEGQPDATQRSAGHSVRAAVRRARQPLRPDPGRHGVTVSVRKSRGRDIRAACGQLIIEVVTTQAPGARLAMLMDEQVKSDRRSRRDAEHRAQTASPSSRHPHHDPLISRRPGGILHLQIVVGHDQRAVLEREARPDGADLRLREIAASSVAPISRSRARARGSTAPATFARHRRRRGAGTIRVRKHVKVRQRRRRQVVEVRSKSSSVSPGKADDHVGANRRMRQAVGDARRRAAR